MPDITGDKVKLTEDELRETCRVHVFEGGRVFNREMLEERILALGWDLRIHRFLESGSLVHLERTVDRQKAIVIAADKDIFVALQLAIVEAVTHQEVVIATPADQEADTWQDQRRAP